MSIKISVMYDDNAFRNSEDIKKINEIIQKIGEPLEGNCLYRHNSKKFEDFEPGHRYNNKAILRKNLWKIAQKSKNVLEVGFNGGHSACLYFFAKPTLKLLSFDICSHKYTEPVVSFLKTKYDLEFVKGNSLSTVPKHDATNKFDMIHIDGGHGHQCALNDLLNCKKFAHDNTILVFDDCQHKPINTILENHIKTGLIKEVNYSDLDLEKCFFHRIFKYTI